jgi:hypothetical protein
MWCNGPFTRSGNQTFRYFDVSEDEGEDSGDEDYERPSRDTMKAKKPTPKKVKKSKKPKKKVPSIPIEVEPIIQKDENVSKLEEENDRLREMVRQLQQSSPTPLAPKIIEELVEEPVVEEITLVPTKLPPNRYDWNETISDESICQSFYQISTKQLLQFEYFLDKYICMVTCAANKSIPPRKQFLLLIDYLINNPSIENMGKKASLPPKFIASILDNLVNEISTHLYNNAAKDWRLMSTNIDRMDITYRVYGKNESRLGTSYFIVDHSTDKIVLYGHPKSSYEMKKQMQNLACSDSRYSKTMIQRMGMVYRIVKTGVFDNYEQGVKTYSIVCNLWNIYS